ncbi:CAAX prenyl protease-related protein [Desulfobacterota bacterium M19]
MLPFVLPFILYLVFSLFAAQFPDFYPLIYLCTVIVVGMATILLLSGRGIIKVHRHIAPGIIVGVSGIVLWVFLCRLHLEQYIFHLMPDWLAPGKRVSFDPFKSIADPVWQWAFITVRTLGLAVLIPVVEEVFWRGFLLRWVISPDWQEQEIGIFTWRSFLWVTLLFTLAHPEWLAAAVYGALLNILLYWRRDLWNCIVAHGISNLFLVFYILYSKSWGLW